MGAYSKQKGAQFERELCTGLSLWVSHGQKRDLFWRSAMSGGRATVGRTKGHDLNRQAGDICSVSPEGHVLTDRFYIEAKYYKNLDLGALIFGEGKLVGFWLDTCRHARKYGKRPMLVARENRRPALMLLPVASLVPLRPLAWFPIGEAFHSYLLADVLSTSFQG